MPLNSPLHSGLKAFRKCSQVGFSVSHCHTQAEWQRAQQAPLPEGRMPVSFYNRYVCMDDCSVCPAPTTEAYTLCFSPLPLVWQLHCSSVDRNSGSHHGTRNKLAGRHMLGVSEAKWRNPTPWLPTFRSLQVKPLRDRWLPLSLRSVHLILILINKTFDSISAVL